MAHPESVPPGPTSERSAGPTPAGGAFAIAYFRDARGNPCRKEDAAATEIVEFDAAGRAIRRTYMKQK